MEYFVALISSLLTFQSPHLATGMVSKAGGNYRTLNRRRDFHELTPGLREEQP